MIKLTPPTNRDIIAANMTALHMRLQAAQSAANAAIAAMADHNQNRAVGSILDPERLLPECDALYRTIMLLHRSHGSFEQNEVHS